MVDSRAFDQDKVVSQLTQSSNDVVLSSLSIQQILPSDIGSLCQNALKPSEIGFYCDAQGTRTCRLSWQSLMGTPHILQLLYFVQLSSSLKGWAVCVAYFHWRGICGLHGQNGETPLHAAVLGGSVVTLVFLLGKYETPPLETGDNVCKLTPASECTSMHHWTVLNHMKCGEKPIVGSYSGHWYP